MADAFRDAIHLDARPRDPEESYVAPGRAARKETGAMLYFHLDRGLHGGRLTHRLRTLRKTLCAVCCGLTPMPSLVMIALVSALTLNSSAANLMTALKGASSGTLNTAGTRNCNHFKERTERTVIRCFPERIEGDGYGIGGQIINLPLKGSDASEVSVIRKVTCEEREIEYFDTHDC